MSDNPGAILTDGAFHLPQPGLFADLDVGEGSVRLTDEFQNLGPSVQLAILRDWQAELVQQQRRTYARFFESATRQLADKSLPEKLAHFKKACETIGVDCPPDIAILLQQY